MSDGVPGPWPSAGEGRRGGFRFRALRRALIAASIASLGQSQREEFVGDANLKEILVYTHTAWDSLTRSTASCSEVADAEPLAAPVLPLPAGFDQPTELDQTQRGRKVTVARLPPVIHQPGTVDLESIQPPGLLYLKNRYVVPGGRFNEMHGWDSYFIIRGLLRDGRVELARGRVENFFFEIEYHGAVLNANRTYYYEAI